jgi:membrane carboxypeptidase/penicillin-binding protein PbpC
MKRWRLPSFVRIIFICLGAFFIVWLFLRFSPYPQLDAFLRRQYSTVLYDRKGRLISIAPLEEGLKREFLPLERYQILFRIFSLEARTGVSTGIQG